MKQLPICYRVEQSENGIDWIRARMPGFTFLPMPYFPTREEALAAAEKLRRWGEQGDVNLAIATRVIELPAV